MTPFTDKSLTVTVSGTAISFTALPMEKAQVYVFVSTTNCWILQGLAPTATAGAGSMFWPANVPIQIDGRCGANLSVIQDAAGGKASLTKIGR